MKKILFFFLVLFCFHLSYKKTFAIYEDIVPPVEVGPTIFRAQPPNIFESQNYYSNDIENKENQFTCPFNFNISHTFKPLLYLPPIPPSFAGLCIDQEITGIKEEKTSSFLSNDNFRETSIYFGYHQPTDFNQTIEQIKENYSKLDKNGKGIAYRITTPDQQRFLKGKLIEDVIASLKTENKKDVAAIDEQLAWNCNNQCFSLTDDDIISKLGCTRIPVHISEVACYLLKRNKTISYTLENGKTTPATFPYQLPDCSAPLPDSCYEKLYEDLPLIPQGTINTKLTIFNKNNDQEATSTPMNRGIPLAAAIASSQLNFVMKSFLPADQKIEYSTPDQVCKNPIAADPVSDKPSPLTFTAYSENKKFDTEPTCKREMFGIPLPFPLPNFVIAKDTLRGEITYPKSAIENMDVFRTFMLNFIPADAQKNIPQSSTIKENENSKEVPIPEPGYSNDQLYKEFEKWLTPASWQTQ